jgi:hypothetical protein
LVCRKMFRRPSSSEMARPLRRDEVRVAPCPQCGTPMKNMGLDFKAPKQLDIKQWQKVELLYKHGYAFHSCGCEGPGPRPATLREVDSFLAEQESLPDARTGREIAAGRLAARARMPWLEMPRGRDPKK